MIPKSGGSDPAGSSRRKSRAQYSFGGQPSRLSLKQNRFPKTERSQFLATSFSFPSVSKYTVHAEHSGGERRGDAFEPGLKSFGIWNSALRHILASAAAAPGLCHDIFHEGSHIERLARRLRED